jgi:transcriptional regulator with XRE-family HTH domain
LLLIEQGMKENQNTIKSVGQNIRELRLRAGWSLRVAAKSLGISTSALSKIETGVTDVNLSRLEQIADIYGVKLVQLWSPALVVDDQQFTNLNMAIKKVFDLETEIKVFQRKVILLYEKLREQSGNFQAAHS